MGRSRCLGCILVCLLGVPLAACAAQVEQAASTATLRVVAKGDAPGAGSPMASSPAPAMSVTSDTAVVASAPATGTTGGSLHRGQAHPERATVIDGSWLIGSDYPPALYMVPVPVSHCTWRVVDYSTGAVLEEGEYAGPGPAAIWVEDGDLFQSEGCLLWQGYPQLTGTRATADPAAPQAVPSVGASIEDGTWTVGKDAAAGRYRSDRAATGACAYQVDREGGRDDESYRSSSTSRSIPAYLDLRLQDGDVLTTKGCGAWTRVPD
ncbi:MAG: hypothetical protein KGP12_02870 [Actinomycetales bacterium]|nr:hypothetical protein [Actinomycetales bacterium]